MVFLSSYVSEEKGEDKRATKNPSKPCPEWDQGKVLLEMHRSVDSLCSTQSVMDGLTDQRHNIRFCSSTGRYKHHAGRSPPLCQVLAVTDPGIAQKYPYVYNISTHEGVAINHIC